MPVTGACRHVFETHAAEVTCCVGSEDGDLILAGDVARDLLLQLVMLVRIISISTC